jgi:hypothetical protein
LARAPGRSCVPRSQRLLPVDAPPRRRRGAARPRHLRLCEKADDRVGRRNENNAAASADRIRSARAHAFPPKTALLLNTSDAESAPAGTAGTGVSAHYAVAVNGACDGISDIAIPFPFGTLATLCGLAFEDRDKLAAWADAVNWDAPWSPTAFELLNYLVEAIGSDERPALVLTCSPARTASPKTKRSGYIRFFASPKMACRQPSGQRSFSWPRTPNFVPCCAKTPIK